MVMTTQYSPTNVSISGYDYNFTFPVTDYTELVVYTLDADDNVTYLTYDVDFTADTGAGTIQTGSYVAAVWTPAEPSGESIVITRDTALEQTADIPTRGGFNESVIEGVLDKMMRIIQELSHKVDTTIDVDPTAEATLIAQANAAVTAAEAAQTAAEAAQAAAEAEVASEIADLVNVTTGHEHDGVDSKKVAVSNLNTTGLDDGILKISGGSIISEPSGLVEIFDASGNWTCPTDVNVIFVSLIGGGGGGQGGGGGYAGSGGGAGSSILKQAVQVTPGNTYAVTVGAGGTAGPAGSGGSGGTGGASSFVGDNETLSATGGGGSTGINGGTGGTGASGNTNLDGAAGSAGAYIKFAGGDGGTKSGTTPGGGGSAYISPAYYTASSPNYGAGGRGGATNAIGYVGGAGLVTIEYAPNETPS